MRYVLLFVIAFLSFAALLVLEGHWICGTIMAFLLIVGLRVEDKP